MQIHFFEEYTTHENLSKAAELGYPCTLFLAAESLDEFHDAADRLAAISPDIEAAYWPILPRSYWISPFAHQDELFRLGQELAACPASLKILFDLELPLLQSKLFVQNARQFAQNKALIEKLFRHAFGYDVSVYTAEYAAPYPWMDRLMSRLGIAYPHQRCPHTKIAMYYSSLAPRRTWAHWWGHQLLQRMSTADAPFQVGIGTIATGVFGNEPILSPQDLEHDLLLLQQFGVEEAVIFRLGGLNPEYLRVIHRFQDGS